MAPVVSLVIKQFPPVTPSPICHRNYTECYCLSELVFFILLLQSAMSFFFFSFDSPYVWNTVFDYPSLKQSPMCTLNITGFPVEYYYSGWTVDSPSLGSVQEEVKDPIADWLGATKLWELIKEFFRMMVLKWSCRGARQGIQGTWG